MNISVFNIFLSAKLRVILSCTETYLSSLLLPEVLLKFGQCFFSLIQKLQIDNLKKLKKRDKLETISVTVGK